MHTHICVLYILYILYIYIYIYIYVFTEEINKIVLSLNDDKSDKRLQSIKLVEIYWYGAKI